MSKFKDDNIPSSHLPRVIIIGGGFGGIQAAKELVERRIQVVLFDKNNYHNFQPLLYQVATGGLEAGSIAYPIRKIFPGYKNFFYRMANVLEVDSANKQIITSIGNFHFDYLIIATGSTTNFYGLKHVKKFAVPMKSIPEALDLRTLIIQNNEAALMTKDKHKLQQLMNYVIVGGGPTGVELAGALAELRKHVLHNDYHELDIPQMQIHLLEAAPRLLMNMSPKSSEKAKRFLEEMGVEVWLGTQVKDYDSNTVYFNDDDFIHTSSLIWAAGVVATSVKGFHAEQFLKNKRIRVDEFNRVIGSENIFAIGDVAGMISKDYPSGHPMVAPVAMQQGKRVASNIYRIIQKKQLKPFRYIEKGTMATIGRNKAVAELVGLRFHGFTAWCIWMVVHLVSLIGFRNKLMVFLDWVWNYFSFDRAMRIIIKSNFKVSRSKYINKIKFNQN